MEEEIDQRKRKLEDCEFEIKKIQKIIKSTCINYEENKNQLKDLENSINSSKSQISVLNSRIQTIEELFKATENRTTELKEEIKNIKIKFTLEENINNIVNIEKLIILIWAGKKKNIDSPFYLLAPDTIKIIVRYIFEDLCVLMPISLILCNQTEEIISKINESSELNLKLILKENSWTKLMTNMKEELKNNKLKLYSDEYKNTNSLYKIDLISQLRGLEIPPQFNNLKIRKFGENKFAFVFGCTKENLSGSMIGSYETKNYPLDIFTQYFRLRFMLECLTDDYNPKGYQIPVKMILLKGYNELKKIKKNIIVASLDLTIAKTKLNSLNILQYYSCCCHACYEESVKTNSDLTAKLGLVKYCKNGDCFNELNAESCKNICIMHY